MKGRPGSRTKGSPHPCHVNIIESSRTSGLNGTFQGLTLTPTRLRSPVITLNRGSLDLKLHGSRDSLATVSQPWPGLCTRGFEQMHLSHSALSLRALSCSVAFLCPQPELRGPWELGRQQLPPSSFLGFQSQASPTHPFRNLQEAGPRTAILVVDSSSLLGL